MGGKILSKKNNFKKNFFKDVIAVLVADVILIGIMLCFAINDENSGKYSSTPSCKAVAKMAASAVTNKEAKISDQELNDLLAYILSKSGQASNIVKGIYVDIIDNTQTAKIYVPITYKGLSLGLSGNLNINLNDELSRVELTLSKTKVGKLPIPSRIVSKMIAKDFENYLKYDEPTIWFNSKIKLNFEYINITAQIKILEIKDDNLFIKF